MHRRRPAGNRVHRHQGAATGADGHQVNLVRRWRLVIVLVAAPVSVLLVLRLAPDLDLAGFSSLGHLLVVSGIASCALAAASAAMVTAVRSRQPGVIWLGIGCMAVGLFMLGHGLTTPGVMGRPPNEWVGRFPYAAMLVFALCLAAAGQSPMWRPNRLLRAHPFGALAVPTLAMASLVVAVVAFPTVLAGSRPLRFEENTFDVLTAFGIVLLLSVMRTHGLRWHLGYDIVQFAIVLAAGMSIAALVAFEHGKFGQLSWWDYHGYLLAGFGGAVYSVFRRRHQERALTDVLEVAFVDDPFDHIVLGYPAALRSLVRAVEIKDAYTHGHSERTAHLAVELGLRLGLPSDQLRVVARGAYLHDLGKIAIPDHILNKPGALTEEERLTIEAHPELGYELASSAPSLAEALPVILNHHERFDGGGYPAGVAGTNIPLEARVVSVADVWDALTSDRAYRPGWAPAMALAHIEAGAGTHFDPRVVKALVAVVAGWGVTTDGERGRPEEAWNAAQTCHEVDAGRVPVDA